MTTDNSPSRADSGAATRRLGILGGMAWPSTAEAYRLINTEVGRRRGGGASADLIVVSLDFAQVEQLQATGDWDAAGRLLGDGAARLAAAGADAVMLCTNTMHKVAADIERIGGLPLIHIADATARAIVASGCDSVGLLGTRFTMEEDFYVDRLLAHGIRVTSPPEEDRRLLHDIIYDELVAGVITAGSRAAVGGLVSRLIEVQQVDGIIAGCTEIELLLGPDDVAVDYFPTTRIHTEAAVDWILEGP